MFAIKNLVSNWLSLGYIIYSTKRELRGKQKRKISHVDTYISFFYFFGDGGETNKFKEPPNFWEPLLGGYITILIKINSE